MRNGDNEQDDSKKLELGCESKWEEVFECPMHILESRCEFCGGAMNGVSTGQYWSMGCARNAEMVLELREQMHWSSLAVRQLQLEHNFPSRAFAL